MNPSSKNTFSHNIHCTSPHFKSENDLFEDSVSLLCSDWSYSTVCCDWSTTYHVSEIKEEKKISSRSS